MDEKGGLGSIRNWNFSEQAPNVNTVLKPVSDATVTGGSALDGSSGVSKLQADFLQVGSFPNDNTVISEAAAKTSAMEFTSWVHRRNFLCTAKAGPESFQGTQVNPGMELVTVPGVLKPEPDASQNGDYENNKVRKQQPSAKKSKKVASKVLRPKQLKQKPSVSTKQKGASVSAGKREKKNQDIVIHGATLDFSHVPAPVCSCTGVPHQCYRWGVGGWQSSCCTTSISEYPLPMSSSRPGARMAGRKMSNGAYSKLLHRLATEGHDLSNAVDLKNYWARHGTNKFVTIR